MDSAIIAAPVLAITWSGTAVALHQARAALQVLAHDVSTTMIDALSSSQDLLSITAAALSDSSVRAAAAALQSALWHAVQPAASLWLVIAAIYWIGCEGSAWQATPGKRALGLRVTDVDGRRIGFARAMARHFAGALSWFTLNLGHLLAAVPPERRALHDLLAGTRVVHSGEPLPTWARAWLAAQMVAAIAATICVFQLLQDALRQAIASAL